MASTASQPHPDVHRSDDGFGLIEVLVVCLIMPIIVFAILSVLDTAAQSVPRDVEWTHAIAEGRVGVARMTREIRQADVINGATPNRIDFDVTTPSGTRRVEYACDVLDPTGIRRRCVRVETAPGTELPALSTGALVVDRILNGTLADPVFGYTPDALGPRYVSTHVMVPASGERSGQGSTHPVVFDDGAYLRNQDLGR